jgi:polar amino acid transport system permease protein
MTSESTNRPGRIHARPVPHPGRWVAVISSAVRNPRWDWPYAFAVMNYAPVLDGLIWGTIVGTVGAMIIGVSLGITVAVMRLSDNPVLRSVGAVYTWFFRAIPRYVLLVLLGTGLGFLYPNLTIGVPFGQDLAAALGLSPDALTFATLNVNAYSSTIIMGIIGLGLSEAAYMAEIARAGILSVDRGQTEAAQAIGMSPGKIMWRIVLPQAMRVIVPPTGNETIAMVKDTSLLNAIPVIVELFYQTQVIGNRTLKIMPSLMAATMWYLIVCSVLMVGQYFLEKRFGRGFGQQAPDRRAAKAARLKARTQEH